MHSAGPRALCSGATTGLKIAWPGLLRASWDQEVHLQDLERHGPDLACALANQCHADRARASPEAGIGSVLQRARLGVAVCFSRRAASMEPFHAGRRPRAFCDRNDGKKADAALVRPWSAGAAKERLTGSTRSLNGPIASSQEIWIIAGLRTVWPVSWRAKSISNGSNCGRHFLPGQPDLSFAHLFALTFSGLRYGHKYGRSTIARIRRKFRVSRRWWGHG